jgi:hypothetical protein
VKFSKLLAFLAILALMTVSTLAFAQDDEEMSADDTPAIVPQPQNSNNPPIILDETDSSGVSDVEEYEG